jgi:hypothetical protein
MIAGCMVVVALAGCGSASAPPGTPGSVAVYVHGRTDASVGVSGR